MKAALARFLHRIADRLDPFEMSEQQFDRAMAEGTPVESSALTALMSLPTLAINGTAAVWSEDYGAYVACCPTRCDPDCELNESSGCHEHHNLPRKRDHDPIACEARQAPRLTGYSILTNGATL